MTRTAAKYRNPGMPATDGQRYTRAAARVKRDARPKVTGSVTYCSTLAWS
jgi:hypothetical protein